MRNVQEEIQYNLENAEVKYTPMLNALPGHG